MADMNHLKNINITQLRDYYLGTEHTHNDKQVFNAYRKRLNELYKQGAHKKGAELSEDEKAEMRKQIGEELHVDPTLRERILHAYFMIARNGEQNAQNEAYPFH